MPSPKQPPCQCCAYPFPHRLHSGDCYGEEMDYEQYYGADEGEIERRLDERERSNYVNQLNRNAAK